MDIADADADACSATPAGLVELVVPRDALSICAALQADAARQALVVIICVEPGFVEPQEAWPLELAAAGPQQPQRLEIRGPPDRSAALRDVALTSARAVCSDPLSSSPAVLLRDFTVRGRVTLSGECCALDGCEVGRGIEITSSASSAAVRHCSLRHCRVGLFALAPCLVASNLFESCVVGVSVSGNPAAVLAGNRFVRCTGAAVVLHFCVGRSEGSSLRLQPTIDAATVLEECARLFEVRVEVAEVASRSFLDEWPLTEGAYSFGEQHGRTAEVEVAEGGASLHVTGGSCPLDVTGGCRSKRKRRRRWRAEAAQISQERAKSLGPAWALSALGIEGDGRGLTCRQLSKAYRLRAREVHPDKQQNMQPKAAAAFQKVAAAYEALLPALRKGARPPS